MSASVWDDITTTTILNSWNPLLTHSSNQDQSTNGEQEVLLDSLAAQFDSNLVPEDIDIWLGEDANGYQLYTEDEIVRSVTEQANDTDEEEEEEQDTTQTQPIPTHKEVTSMLDKCLVWHEHQEESRPTSLLLLKEIRDLAASKWHSSLKQTKLTFFFC